MVTRTTAIQNFLLSVAPQDLARLYSHDMEVQVNVAQDGGERVEGEFKGRQWHGWTDGTKTWKSFRIPYGASSNPEYTDTEIFFDLAEHAEGIGMTGWDWKSKVSKWVAFDFDAIVGHSDKHGKKLDPEQLESVRKAACEIPWVTVRKSTSGTGLHLYVFLQNVPTNNHNEHAALARAILGIMSAMTGFDFASKIDVCGGNMWVWHRKFAVSKGEGLKLIKTGTVLEEIPINWRDHVPVVQRKRRKTLPGFVPEGDIEITFEDLIGQRTRTPLDERHKSLLRYLQENNALWWWDQDNHMLVAHTYDLACAHKELGMAGIFETLSKGSEHGQDQNCFAFPLRKGAWVVRRHTRGVSEADCWEQDTGGWTKCYLNREPDLRTASRHYGGVEGTDGSFVFREAEVAMRAAQQLGASFDLDSSFLGRLATLKRHKDGRLIVEVDHHQSDDGGKMKGWLFTKKKWQRIISANMDDPAEPDNVNYDDFLRHVITSSREDSGWFLRTEEGWINEPLTHIKAVLKAIGKTAKEVDPIIGTCAMKPWMLVNYPFQPEYPGDRKWNKTAAQLNFPLLDDSEQLTYPTWLSILNHCGQSLNQAVREHPWCKANAIQTGADYLKCWVASLLQEPAEPLPYLFFYGEQNSGKSIFHEALALLFSKGCGRADQSLTTNFNGELEGLVVCILEETDLNNNKAAYNKIKDWVTSKELPIHKKGQTPYSIPNSTHWIQCANEYSACPIFDGDTRITMIHVPPLDIGKLIPKKELIPLLLREAPHFLTAVMRLELPSVVDRLNIPVILTDDKASVQELNKNALERFLTDNTFYVPGASISIDEFCAHFHNWLPPNEVSFWTKIKIGHMMPPKHPKGRIYDKENRTNNWYYGNLSLEPRESSESRLIAVNQKLVPEQ